MPPDVPIVPDAVATDRPLLGALLGALGALAIGLSDLFGRRIVLASTPLTAAATLQLSGGLISAAAVAVIPSQWLWPDIGRGLISGVGMAVGLSCYYTGLVRSTSTVVAPLVATLAAVVPFGYVLATTEQVSTLGIVGAATAFVGLALVSVGASEVAAVRAGIRWGALSGIGYGVGIAVLTDVSGDSGSWPAASQRFSALAVLALLAAFAHIPLTPPRGTRVSAALAGVFVATTTISLLIGVQFDAGAAVVTVSMFPAFSVGIGRIFFGDPIRRWQAAGIAIVLTGIAGVVAA